MMAVATSARKHTSSVCMIVSLGGSFRGWLVLVVQVYVVQLRPVLAEQVLLDVPNRLERVVHSVALLAEPDEVLDGVAEAEVPTGQLVDDVEGLEVPILGLVVVGASQAHLKFSLSLIAAARRLSAMSRMFR